MFAPGHRKRGAFDSALAPLNIARMIRQAAPDVVMSFGMGVSLAVWLALAAAPGRRPYWICREDSNTDAEIANLTRNPAARAVLRAILGRMHRSADCLLAVAEELGAKLAHQTPRARVRVIHNPIDLDAIEESAPQPLAEAPTRPFIVAAGRLVRQKGFDVLLEAFARSREARALDLVILGEGPLEGALRRQAEGLGIADRVRFAGFQANPWAWFARARLFVLSSRWEGFGNVVAEAMACGVPVLVTDCDFGPREQVAHGVTGWVTPVEPEAMARAMDTSLGDADLAGRLAAAGRVRARDFATPTIVDAYTRLLLNRPAVGSETQEVTQVVAATT